MAAKKSTSTYERLLNYKGTYLLGTIVDSSSSLKSGGTSRSILLLLLGDQEQLRKEKQTPQLASGFRAAQG